MSARAKPSTEILKRLREIYPNRDFITSKEVMDYTGFGYDRTISMLKEGAVMKVGKTQGSTYYVPDVAEAIAKQMRMS